MAKFIGLAQVVAAVLLLIPPLAQLGAAMFLPIIVNIFVSDRERPMDCATWRNRGATWR